MTPQQVYDALSAIDRGGANAYREWHDRTQYLSDGFAPPMATRGALVGHLDELLKDYRGAMEAAGYEDTDPRHLLLALLIGYGSGSSMALTDGQAKMLLHSLTENNGDGGWELEPTLSEQFRLIVATAISARIPLPIPHTQEATKPMVERSATVTEFSGMPHLKTVSITYERKLNLGDYNSATIGVQYWADIEEGTDHDEALAAMWEHAKEQVKAQALPLVRHTKGNAPNPGVGGAPTPTATRRTVQHPASGPAAPPSAGAPSAPPAGGGNGGDGGDVKSGTAKLNKLMIQPDGKIEFYVEGMRFPFKDSRGPAVVAGLFDAELGWTEAHLSQPAMYDASQFGTLYVDWEKPGKYWDVVRVHA